MAIIGGARIKRVGTEVGVTLAADGPSRMALGSTGLLPVLGEVSRAIGSHGRDDEVCIGDRFRIGGAVVEVSQPRDTCYRVGIRLNHPQMAALLVARFYFRVI